MGQTLLFLAGLDGLSTSIIQNWIGPAFLLLMAAMSIKFLISREFRQVAVFLGIGALVAVIIYAGPMLFGPGGIFTNIAKEGANQLNAYMLLR